jgi:hypothetical protein
MLKTAVELAAALTGLAALGAVLAVVVLLGMAA